MINAMVSNLIPRLPIGETYTIRDSLQNGHVSVWRVPSGIHITETMDNVEESLFLSHDELQLITRLLR